MSVFNLFSYFIITDCNDTLYYVKAPGKNQTTTKKVKVLFSREEVGSAHFNC